MMPDRHKSGQIYLSAVYNERMIQIRQAQAGDSTLEKVICEVTVKIKNADGMHMSPAMKFVDTANTFNCDITVSKDDVTVDGKSMLGVCTLCAPYGTELHIKAEGADASEAVKALQVLVEQKMFDEPPPKKDG